MDIAFATRALENQANDVSLCKRKLGARRAVIYHRRLGVLRAARTLEDVRHAPGRFHMLTADRKGEWACDLDHPYRLIFEPQEDPIPTLEDGSYNWGAITAIRILEIIDYHK